MLWEIPTITFMFIVAQHCPNGFQLNIRNDSSFSMQYDTLVCSSIYEIFLQGTGCSAFHMFLTFFCAPGLDLTSNRNEYQSCLVRG